jgi:hypothetical protein
MSYVCTINQPAVIANVADECVSTTVGCRAVPGGSGRRSTGTGDWHALTH